MISIVQKCWQYCLIFHICQNASFLAMCCNSERQTCLCKKHENLCLKAECLETIPWRAMKLVKGLKRKPYQEWLKSPGLYSLQQRRLRVDLIKTFRILTGKEHVDSQSFFQLATDSHNLCGPDIVWNCSCQGARQLFKRRFSVQELLDNGTLCHNMWSKLQQWIPPRIDWTSTGQIWASKLQAASSSSSSTVQV